MSIRENYPMYLQGAAVGAIALAIVGFSWGGWVTGSTARKDAMAASHDAVVSALAPVCAARFQAQAEAPSKLSDLVKTSSYERGQVIEKAGFATIAGNNSVESDVASACADMLVNLAKPKG
jgi:alpha/beta superfamily hydrolase